MLVGFRGAEDLSKEDCTIRAGDRGQAVAKFQIFLNSL